MFNIFLQFVCVRVLHIHVALYSDHNLAFICVSEWERKIKMDNNNENSKSRSLASAEQMKKRNLNILNTVLWNW